MPGSFAANVPRGSAYAKLSSNCPARVAHGKAFRSDLQAGEGRAALEQIAVTRQRVERETVSIEMVFEIEDPGKTGACEISLVPRTVGILIVDQPGDGAPGSSVFRAREGKKSDYGPGGLRRRADSLPFL